MTNTEQAKLTGMDGLDQYMSETAINTILNANAPFTLERGKFTTNYVAAKNKAATVGTDNTGFSMAKQANKIAMSNLVAMYAGYAYVKWDEDNLNKPDLQLQMHIHPSYYMGLSDAQAAAKATGVRDVMNDHLTPDLVGYVTAADILLIDNAISKFVNTQGSSDAAHLAEPVETAAFKTALHKADLSMHKLPIMARFLIGTANEEIYNKIVKLAQIPTINIHHTDIVLEVYDKITNEVIKNAVPVYSKTTKEVIEDLQGFYHWEHVHFGQGLLTVSAPGYITVEMIVNVQRGKLNHFIVKMEKS